MQRAFAIAITIGLACGDAVADADGRGGALKDRTGCVVTLAREGAATCTIVISEEAIEFERLAARELRDYLEKVTGARPPVARAPAEGANVYVGSSSRVRALVPDVDFDALGSDGIVMRTIGDDIVLSGGRPRGVLFAVYSFLQDVVGVQWWAHDAQFVSARRTLTVRDLNVVYRPPFDMRHFLSGALHDKPTFAQRMRQNGHLMRFDTAEHSVVKLLAPEKKYFDPHPDWFMYSPDDGSEDDSYSYVSGLRVIRRIVKTGRLSEASYEIAERTRRLPWQVCTTSEGAREALTKAVLALLADKHPAWEGDPKVVMVSQRDGRWECRCDACLAVRQREGSPSGSWIHFVNAIAERVEREYPDVLIGTMAFLHTLTPPSHARPRHNVLVQAIPVTRNRKLPIGSETADGRIIASWCDIARHVYIWEHDTNFRNWIKPHANHFVLPRGLRFYQLQGVKGIVVHGGYGGASEFERMRAWVNAQLMWDPQQDERALMEKFLQGYYGDAGPMLMIWIDVQHHAVHRSRGIGLGSYATSTRGWLTLEDLNTGTRLFEQALRAVADDETLSYRVRRARLSIDIVWLERYAELRRAAREKGQPFLGPDDPQAALMRIAANEFSVNSYREWADFSEYTDRLRTALSTPD